MLLQREQSHFGVNAVLLHHAARRVKERLGGFSGVDTDDAFAVALFAESLGMPEIECRPVLAALVRAGWLAKGPAGAYLVRRPFAQLSMARIGRPLARSKAASLVKRIVEEAKTINRETQGPCDFVLEVALFGSYLDPSKQELGDLDVAVRTHRRSRPPQSPHRAFDWRQKSGAERAKTRLRGRSPYISLHDLEEVVQQGFAYQVMYRMRDDLPRLHGDLAAK